MVRLAALLWIGAVLGACGSDDLPGTPTQRDAGLEPEPNRLVTDPLSMPESPTLDAGDFMGAEACGTCHTTHYERWRKSMHAYAMVDPVYRALVEVRQDDYDGMQDMFCTQCHSAIATRGGEITPGFSFDDLSDIALEGVTCEACHKVESVMRPYNSGHMLDPGGPMRGPLQDPMANGVHESEYGAHFESSEFCAGCHDVIEVSGMNLERAYEEWLESPSAEQRDNCQSCHMPNYDGEAADGAGVREGLHSHAFIGVDIPLEDGFVTEEELVELREDARGLLVGSVGVTLSAPVTTRRGAQLDLVVTVDNHIDGHSFPTGSTSLRQAWLEVVATDADGQVLYRTGDLDDNGDLRDFFSELDPYGDQDLITFHSRLVDPLGEPEVFPWRAIEHFTNSIPPRYDRTYTLFVPTEGAAPGPVSVTARVRFRTHAPFLLRALGLERLIDKLEIYEVAADGIEVELEE